MKRKIKCFIFEIHIEQECWDYVVGQTIFCPVFAKTLKNARTRFDNEHWGSEYPNYSVKTVHECDSDGCFDPLKTCKESKDKYYVL